jgi:hypothetical protein
VKGTLTWIVELAGIVLLSYWCQRSTAMHGMEAYFAPHRHALLTITVGAALLGFVLFMAMTVFLALTRGTPMTPDEIAAQSAQVKYPAASFRAYRFWGRSAGREFHVDLSFGSIKDAFRTGKVLFDPGWRPLFLMGVGFWLMFLGGFGAAFFAGPPLVKLLVGPAVAYALVRTAWAFWKA